MAQKNNPEETKAHEPNKIPEANKAPKEKIRDFNIFIANSVYPEAEQIFTAKFKSLRDIKDDCIVVVDTNALLIPYKVDEESLEQIKKTYLALSDKKRLVIPGQTAREFAKNRANKVGEVFEQLERKRDAINKVQTGNYPLLASLDKYKEILELEKNINGLVKNYREAVNEILEGIRSWIWDDPVTVLYGELFKGIVLDIEIDENKIRTELTERQIHKIPPGYKDASKDDGGVGDYLIWKTILHLGEKYNKSVLFVSGEEKPDWWHRSNNKPLYPRYELIDEFRRCSKGQTFHIVSFADFLNLYGASTEVVEYVRSKEHLPAPPSRNTYGDEIKPLPLEYFTENVVAIWLSMNYRSSVINSSERGDFQIVHPNEILTEVIIITISSFSQYVKAIKKINNRLDQLYATNSKSAEYTLPIVVLACASQLLAYEIVDEVSSKSRFSRNDFAFVLGFLTNRPRFVDIYRDATILSQPSE